MSSKWPIKRDDSRIEMQNNNLELHLQHEALCQTFGVALHLHEFQTLYRTCVLRVEWYKEKLFILRARTIVHSISTTLDFILLLLVCILASGSFNFRTAKYERSMHTGWY